MKAKDLSEILMQHPEFEVKALFVDTSNCTASNPWPIYHTLNVTGIADIGHSDKVVVLDVE